MVQHFDEISRETERREKALLQEQRLQYRQELEEQRLEVKARAKLAQETSKNQEKLGLQKHLKLNQTIDQEEQQRQDNRRERAARLMQDNLKWKHKQRLEDQQRKEQEMRTVAETVHKVQAEEAAEVALAQNAKSRVANALKLSYELKTQLKKQQQKTEKQADLQYTRQQQEQLGALDKERQQVSGIVTLLVF